MLNKTRALLQELSAYLSLWPIVGAAVMSAAAGWAAWATERLEPYAPASWLFAALLGAIVFLLVVRLAVAIRTAIISASIRQRFYQHTDRINPLEHTFRDQRINLADLISPFEPYIRNKTFIDCELIGPMSILFLATSPGSGTFTGCHFISCDAIRTKTNFKTENATVFQDCHFIRGKIFRLTLLVPSDSCEFIKSSMPGINWITESDDLGA